MLRSSCFRLTASSSALCVAADAALRSAGSQHRGTFGMDLLHSVKLNPTEALTIDGHAGLRFPFKVTASVCDVHGEIDAGALAALADVFTTVHLWALSPGSKHVSTDFTVRCFRNIDAHDAHKSSDDAAAVECITEVSKLGKRLGFTKFHFLRNGRRIAEGTHTKAMLGS